MREQSDSEVAHPRQACGTRGHTPLTQQAIGRSHPAKPPASLACCPCGPASPGRFMSVHCTAGAFLWWLVPPVVADTELSVFRCKFYPLDLNFCLPFASVPFEYRAASNLVFRVGL